MSRTSVSNQFTTETMIALLNLRKGFFLNVEDRGTVHTSGWVIIILIEIINLVPSHSKLFFAFQIFHKLGTSDVKTDF